MEQESIQKNNRSDTTDTIGERPEMPDSSGDGESFNNMPRFGGGPSEMTTTVGAVQQMDPMLPLVYFTAGAGSALIAFLVFYLCIRFLPRKPPVNECQHTYGHEEKLAVKKHDE